VLARHTCCGFHHIDIATGQKARAILGSFMVTLLLERHNARTRSRSKYDEPDSQAGKRSILLWHCVDQYLKLVGICRKERHSEARKHG
jgi:hypothetical protein